ncbi:hypothetical protein [Helicobacter sp. 16-1353]|uniref:hypothetical protein n=1 Tax=Helicobacter sp. 16-1353 TaxID=2004996 RepID=UPI0011BF0F10|nr:hypothetical protein [Helicobacter sp. 16-1353]
MSNFVFSVSGNVAYNGRFLYCAEFIEDAESACFCEILESMESLAFKSWILPATPPHIAFRVIFY